MYSWKSEKETSLAALATLIALLLPGHSQAQSIDNTLDGLVSGPSSFSFGSFGFSVAMAGDVNGDGFDDILVGDTSSDNPPGDGQPLGSGLAYLIPGKANGLTGRTIYSDTSFRRFFLSQDPVNSSGLNVADVGNVVRSLGDINDDGIGDFFIGVSGRRVDFDPNGDPLNNQGNDFPIGSGYVIYGTDGTFPADSDLRDLTEDGIGGFEILGRDIFGRLGSDAGAAGDVNGDGIDDLIISAPRAGIGALRDNGEVYVIFGQSGGYSEDLSSGTISGSGIAIGALDGSNGFVIAGQEFDDELGRSVAGIGDFNADGFADIAVSSPLSFQFRGETGIGSIVGAVYVVFGSASGYDGVFDLGSLDGRNGFSIYNAFGNETSGQIAGVGDVNGDGFDDFGILLRNQPTQIILGRDQAIAPVLDARNPPVGRAFPFIFNRQSLSGIGDINGDGFDDIAVGNRFGVNIGYGSSIGFSSQSVGNPVGATLNFATSISGNGGDFNGDGVADFVIGSSGAREERGAVALLLGEDTDAEYLSWIDQFYPGVTDLNIIGRDQDPNGDGINNTLAYALDLSASETPTGSLINMSLDGEFAIFSFRQRAEAREIFPLVVELSSDMTIWFRVFDGVFGVSRQVDPDFFAPGTDRVRVSVPTNYLEEFFSKESGRPFFGRVRAIVR